MEKSDLEDIEMELLLEAIYQRYGHDFRDYARASIRRRIAHALKKLYCNTISEMMARILHDESFFESMLADFSINVTEMFRDPPAYRALREKVIPVLRTYPFIKIWHAGCSTGEEVYSLAILLEEEGLYDRCTIFATDFNDNVLQKAKEGIYPLSNVKQFTANYQRSGGDESFSNYYHAEYDNMIMNKKLKRNITWANHNLATDGVFSEVHLVFCRNVLIYFNRTLQNRVLKIITESLVRGGFLCLGNKESLLCTDEIEFYKNIDNEGKVYQKMGEQQ